jgi:hypothetical protein
LIGCPTSFSRRSLDQRFLFGLPILDRIESPTAAVTKRLYSNLDVDLAPAATHTPAIAADMLAPSPLRPALAGCRGPSAGCCAYLGRLSRSSRRRRLHAGRLAFTNRAATSDASSEGRLSASLPASRLHGLHRRSVFAVTVRDFTDNDTTVSDLCAIVKDLANSAAVGLINRSDACLRQVRPRARAYHRSSIGLPLRRPFGP